MTNRSNQVLVNPMVARPLSRGERFILTVAIYMACTCIAVVEWISPSRRQRFPERWERP
jgi:hypothetical protein